MRIFVFFILCLGCLVGCSQPPEIRAKKYTPLHVKNGVYRFELASWPYSLAEFEERYGDSLEVIAFGPSYNQDGTKVIAMVVLTRVKTSY